MPGIVLPKLGYATSEGTVLRWLKTTGEAVAAGESLVEVALEKTVHVLVAGQDGVVLAVYAPAGAIVPEGETLGWLGAQGESPPAHTVRLLGWEEEVAPAPPELAERMAAPAGAPGLATGAGEQASAQLQDFEALHRGLLRGQLRRVTSQRMAKSWRDAPKVDLFAEVDFGLVEQHRARLKGEGREAPSYNVYIAHAVVKAFQDLPGLNFYQLGEQVVPLREINVGLAVALGDNLVTVSMKDLGGAGLLEIQRRFKNLLKKALRLSLSRAELYGSSLTVTNLGEFDVTAFTAVLNPPETFILAIGKVEPRVIVKEGQMAIAPMCTFCLSFDHRAVDGAPASRLLQRIKLHMESEAGPL